MKTKLSSSTESVEIKLQNGTVTLQGTVYSEEAKKEIERVLEDMLGDMSRINLRLPKSRTK